MRNDTGPRPARLSAARLVFRSAVLAGLLVLAGYQLTRSDGLEAAGAAYRRGDFVTGARRAADHLGRRPWSRAAARLAGLCLTRLDFAGAAEPYYRRAGRLGLDDLHTRAYGLVRGNLRLEAEAAYRDILRRHPDDPLALRRLGAELIVMMRWDDALAVARRLSKTPGGAIDGLAMVGAIEHHNDRAAAAAAYRRILELDPDLQRLPSSPAFRRVFWTQLTEDLLASGQAEAARRFLADAPAQDRGPTLTWLAGRVCAELGEPDEAERLWRESVRADPNLTDAWVDLGRLALVRMRPQDAVGPLERASALDPGAYAPASHLATAYERLGQSDRARDFRKKAERLRRGLPAAPAPAGSPPRTALAAPP